MASSRVSAQPSTSERTVKAKDPKALNWKKLGYRFIVRKNVNDPKFAEITALLMREQPQIPLSELRALKEICLTTAKKIESGSSEDCLDSLDDLVYEVEKGKFSSRLPIIHKKRFNFYVQDNRDYRNEAWLQRTLMPAFLDSLWVNHETFTYTAESIWNIPYSKMIPSTCSDQVSQPKPDCAISFTKEAITGEYVNAPVPPDLERCICPDADDGERNFPFLFMEVKKGMANPEGAYISSLHATSQALYNIYHWMKRSDHLEIFYEHVRVFSFVFNATQLSVRVHRAEQKPNGQIGFYFDTVFQTGPNKEFSRNEACGLVTAILDNYAEKKLLPLLKESFKKTSVEESRVQEQMITKLRESKRKNGASNTGSSKRSRQATSSSIERSSSDHMGSTQELADLAV